ncbi:hypothetical protein BDZ89DRAFT_1160138 [Hymenopellis radicata]|nr:hypothetical protein BDZ89DRAFT_1160138 [Hymenopellis radicata]
MPSSMRNLPSAEERKYLVQDWKELHRKTLEEAIAWALHDAPKPYDFHKTCMWFFLEYRPESQGNPSLAYELIGGKLSPAPDPATTMATSYMAFLPQIEEAYEEEKGNKHFVNVVPTIYVMDSEVMWMTVIYIYTWNLPKYRPNDRPISYRAIHGAHSGLVWRLVGETDNDWAPGLMTKHPNGKKWVWKKHTIDELNAKGIKIPPPGPYIFP